MLKLLTFSFLLLTFYSPAASTAQTWEMVWSDEFDGQALNANLWSAQTGDGCPSLCGWGNNELQWYTGNNTTVANGVLTITARQEQMGGKNYTSSRLRSINKGDWTFGRFEIRAKMPTGKGMWPAIWMLPTDPSIYGVWAASGEIDIMEMVGDKPEEVSGTLHYGATWPGNQFAQNSYTLGNGNFNDDFHVFALEWESGIMRWYVDDTLYGSLNNWSTTGGVFPAPFDVDFHLLLNVAVGGNLPGNPDGSTVFPQTMVVDYVRVFKDISENGEPENVLLFDDMEHGNPSNNAWFTFDGAGGGITTNMTDLPPADGGSFSLDANYPGATGYIGGFGRTRRLNLADATHFNFWINPDAGLSYTLEIQLQDDDNGDDLIPTPSSDDDEFQYNCVISATGPCAVAGGGWQLVSLPLADFFDDNSFHNGGNAVLDAVPVTTGGNGQLVNIAVTVIGGETAVNFTTDYWTFVDSTKATSNDKTGALPSGVHITPAYPNPFTHLATFDLTIDQPQRVKIEVFDLLGRSILLVHNGFLAASEKRTFELDGSDLTNGVYLFQVEGEMFAQTRRIVLIR